MKGTNAARLKGAIVDALTGAFPDAEVTYGIPGTNQQDDLVVVGDQKTIVTRPVMTRERVQEETIETLVDFSVFRFGDETVQRDATESAYAMLDKLDAWLRDGDNWRFADAVDGIIWCRVTEHTLEERVAYEGGSTNLNPVGRISDVTVTITTQVRG